MTRQKHNTHCILYFGNDWSADNRTSSHHIARRLAERFRLYYFECPGLRAPKRSKRDFKKVLSKLFRFFRGTRQVAPSIEVRTLLQLPFHRFASVRRINQLLIYWTLRWFMWREGVRQPITWFMVPHPAPLVGRLGECLSVYYCIDDYAGLPDVNQEAVRTFDEELTRKTDLVFVSSETLLSLKLPVNPNTHFSPHGVDFDLFARAQEESVPIPEATASLSHPIVGFFGLIESWLDLDLLDFLAEQRPSWTFLFIGRIAVARDRLPQRANIHFIGQQPYEALPAFGKQFDVAIIPFLRTPVILHANPLKLREYLAMGKPVVSISTPEIDKFADVAEIAHSREEFLSRLDAVLAKPLSAEEVNQRMQRVASSSWDARLEEVLELIRQNLDEKDTSRSAAHVAV